MKYYLSIKIFIVLTLIIFIHAFSSAQVTQEWEGRFTQGTVSYGREIMTDANGNVYVGGHSVLVFGGEGATVFIKYDSVGNQIWEYQPDNTTDYMEDMAIDADGNIYFSGYRWQGTQFDFLTGKISTDGDSVWVRIHDGIGNFWDRGIGIYVDGNGNVYTTGYGKGTFNGYDMTVIKYDNDGNEQWASQYANPDDAGQLANYKNYGFNVYADADGNVYMSGYAFNGVSHELTLIKYNEDGDQLWERDIDTHGDWSEVTENYMKTDAEGNIYMAGDYHTDSTGCDILLVKYNPAGDLLWMRTWDSDSDYVSGGYYADSQLALDNDGNIYVSGTRTTSGLIFSEDMVTLKYDQDGNFLWEDIFNGDLNDEDRPFGIVVDNAGNPYVTGTTAVLTTWGENDYLTFKLNKETGEHVWDISYDGISSFYDEPHAICVDEHGNIYITGWSSTNNDPFDLRADMVTLKYAPVIVSSIEQNPENISGSLFPSPADDEFRIILPGITGEIAFIMMNENGTVVISRNENINELVSVDSRNLPAGLYLVKVLQGNKTFARKVMIMH